MKRKMLNVRLKDRIQNTIIRQRARVTDKVECIAEAKWELAGRMIWMIYTRRTEWQIQSVGVVGREKHHFRDDIVWQQGRTRTWIMYSS